MPLSPEQQETLFRWLREKGVRKECPACGHQTWKAGDIIAPASAPGGGGTAVGGPTYSLVQLVCQHCSFVMHFATTPIGIESRP